MSNRSSASGRVEGPAAGFVFPPSMSGKLGDTAGYVQFRHSIMFALDHSIFRPSS